MSAVRYHVLFLGAVVLGGAGCGPRSIEAPSSSLAQAETLLAQGDRVGAMRLLESAADTSAEALVRLGSLYMPENAAQGLAYFDSAAVRGSRRGLYLSGYLRRRSPDSLDACRRIRQAAEQGEPEAMDMEAFYATHGRCGREVSLDSAILWQARADVADTALAAKRAEALESWEPTMRQRYEAVRDSLRRAL